MVKESKLRALTREEMHWQISEFLLEEDIDGVWRDAEFVIRKKQKEKKKLIAFGFIEFTTLA